MIGKEISHKLIIAAFILPTSQLQGWTQLSFNKIPQNKVSVEQNSLLVKVENSASPLVYKLPEVKNIKGFVFKIEVNGSLNYKSSDLNFPEDSYFRFGLVAKGEKVLSWFQKKLAANWVLKLFELAPPKIGLDKIYFYNVGHGPQMIGKIRQHPKSDLMIENIIASRNEKNEILVNYQLEKPKEVVALWLSIDGDNSNSSFTTKIKDISLIE